MLSKRVLDMDDVSLTMTVDEEVCRDSVWFLKDNSEYLILNWNSFWLLMN